MFTVDKNNITIIRGDTGMFTIQVQDISGNAVELDASDVLTFTLRRTPRHPEIVMQKNIEPVALTLTIEPEDTEGIAFGKYFYDVELKHADGSVDTIIPPHSFELLEEVTY